ncbi:MULTISPECIES: hypothetical protein [Bacillus]|uniref:hypothetical protein n=1 Tax=Bacillus TaxID=1386 RepID=UPI00142D67E4|nr:MULTISPECIES: hypothetical protein [Bacillus]MCY7581470.1 hypothetical protein [Bacillus altitudinis]MCY7594422.1 hypothetical protein [Bacillus altitudinis]
MKKSHDIIRVQLFDRGLPVEENFFLYIENAQKCFDQHIKDHSNDLASKEDLHGSEPLKINTKINGRDKEATMHVWSKVSSEHNEYDIEPMSVSLEFIKAED